ncbi:DNA topoisomerase IB [Bowdeniella nasicola]|uniref:DNA topoisomerase IB n=1 Tax=Bowdeniella nasicola TaxID=208480 RepID=UPI0011610412
MENYLNVKRFLTQCHTPDCDRLATWHYGVWSAARAVSLAAARAKAHLLGANGARVTHERQLQRIKDLVIPPAWDEVWIAASADSHIQATGVDDAGRLQYIYHPDWREQQDGEKFIRSLAFAEVLPTVRRRVTRDLKGSDERSRALAAAVRMIDTLGLRIGAASMPRTMSPSAPRPCSAATWRSRTTRSTLRSAVSRAATGTCAPTTGHSPRSLTIGRSRRDPRPPCAGRSSRAGAGSGTASPPRHQRLSC